MSQPMCSFSHSIGRQFTTYFPSATEDLDGSASSGYGGDCCPLVVDPLLLLGFKGKIIKETLYTLWDNKWRIKYQHLASF